ncbi:sterol desaturase family protein [Methylocystis sp. IM3]|jgi:sterol desaturase/sphingolipid hydroxylase (fatty acid hydroxylase superfamily)|uniref:sterol desaturase family protein n=1 Tax=unclassified Methylocystis TaxID=2625913 RepID=UPI000FA3C0AE|nr:MAG: sterol desaturase family protein [Hyphomicrobiales bacterium]
MDLNAALHVSLHRVGNELFSAGSVLSVYSLATSFGVALLALGYRQKKRRGRVFPRVIARAVLAKKILTRASVHADIKLFVLSVVFMPVVVGALVVSLNTVSTGVHAMLNSAFGPAEPVECCDFKMKAVSTVVLFLAYEIGYYLDHYLKHRVPFLWELHKLHHTADVLTPLTNYRNHPIDSVVFGYMLALFIGAASGVLEYLYGQKAEFFSVEGKNVLFIIFLWTIGHLQHSEFWIPFRGLWGHFVLSPAHHQIHHSKDPQHFNRNLGSVLAVWDWMFGTLEIPPEKNPRLVYGADEESVDPHSALGMLVTPPVKAAAALWRAVASVKRSIADTWTAATEKLQQTRQG